MDHNYLVVQQRIQNLMNQSQDYYFTEYLKELQWKLQQGIINPIYAGSETERAYKLYVERMNVISKQALVPMNQGQVPMMQAAPVKKKNVEFTIGAVVLSIIGAVFLLAAFVMLGMTYMDSFIKGMCLYAISIAILLFSELVIRRKMPGLSSGVSGTAVSALYISTVINCIYLHNFNWIYAIIITIVIAIITVVISKGRKSDVLYIISFTGFYLALLPVIFEVFYQSLNIKDRVFLSIDYTFILFAGITFLINIALLCIPVNNRKAVTTVHLICNAIFGFLFAGITYGNVENIYLASFLIILFLFQGAIYAKCKKWCVFYIVSEVVLLFTIYIVISKMLEWKVYCILIGLAIACLITFFILRKEKTKWIPYWMLCGMLFLVFGLQVPFGDEGAFAYIRMGVFITIFLTSKWLPRIEALKISEIVFTCLTIISALFTFAQSDLTIAFFYLGAFLLSLLFTRSWKSLYEEIVMVLFVIFVLMNAPENLILELVTCILFAGVFLFNNIPYFRDEHTYIYNYINLGLFTCTYLGLICQKNITVFLIMLALGIMFMILTFRDKYGMNFKYKYLIAVLYLSYMAFVCDIDIPLIKSVLLMVIALSAVAVGFIIRKKSVRICGLSLSLIVCFKLIVFDFAKAASTEKMILFMVTGVIALAISGIYIALEKKIE